MSIVSHLQYPINRITYTIIMATAIKKQICHDFCSIIYNKIITNNTIRIIAPAET
jgi:hypothetical protein